MIDRVERGAQDLRDRPQAVGILHARIVRLVGLDDLGAGQPAAHRLCNLTLPRLAPRLVQPGVQKLVSGPARVDRHRGRRHGRFTQTMNIAQDQGAERAH